MESAAGVSLNNLNSYYPLDDVYAKRKTCAFSEAPREIMVVGCVADTAALQAAKML